MRHKKYGEEAQLPPLHSNGTGPDGSIVQVMDIVNSRNDRETELTSLKDDIEQLRRAILDLEEVYATAVTAAVDMDERIESLVDLSVVVEWTSMDIEETLARIRDLRFTADLDDKAITSIEQMHREFVMKERRELKQLSDREKEILSNHRKELKEVLDTQGFWCSYRTFLWLGGIFIGSLSIIIVSITLWVVIKYC